jgi:hypothetical protein
MAAIMLQWDMDFRPAKYAVVVSTEDGAVDTVAVVVDGRTHETVLFAQVRCSSSPTGILS